MGIAYSNQQDDLLTFPLNPQYQSPNNLYSSAWKNFGAQVAIFHSTFETVREFRLGPQPDINYLMYWRYLYNPQVNIVLHHLSSNFRYSEGGQIFPGFSDACFSMVRTSQQTKLCEDKQVLIVFNLPKFYRLTRTSSYLDDLKFQLESYSF